MSEYLLQIDKRGRIVLPKEVRKAFGLENEKGKLVFRWNPDQKDEKVAEVRVVRSDLRSGVPKSGKKS